MRYKLYSHRNALTILRNEAKYREVWIVNREPDISRTTPIIDSIDSILSNTFKIKIHPSTIELILIR